MNFEFPFSESLIIYLGLAIIMIALSLFFVLIYNLFFAKYFKNEEEEDDEKINKPGCFILLVRNFLILLIIIFGLLVIIFGIYVQSYTKFDKKV